MKKKTKVLVVREGWYFPHVEFLHASHVHLTHVEAKHDGHFYSLLSSFLLSAFSLEAFLNYAGPKVEPHWDEFDRAPTLAKLIHVCTVVGVPVDFSKRPFQSINELFQFRNRLAHPRDEAMKVESIEDLETYQKTFYDQPRPKWMKFATESKARVCRSDVDAIIGIVQATSPFAKDAYRTLLGWSGSAKVIETT